MPKNSVAPKIIATCFALLLIAMGSVFTGLLMRAYSRAAETHAWTEVPCNIISAKVEETRENLHSPIEYWPRVQYSYNWPPPTNDDATPEDNFLGTRIRRVDGPKKSREDALKILAEYPEGSNRLCYVDPNDPKMAILRRETKAAVYTLWFPMLFVIAGVGWIMSVWWPKPVKIKPRTDPSAAPSDPSQTSAGEPASAKPQVEDNSPPLTDDNG